MNVEKERQLKEKMIQQLVGGVSFAEIIKIVHELASRETEHVFSEFSEEQKVELWREMFENA